MNILIIQVLVPVACYVIGVVIGVFAGRRSARMEYMQNEDTDTLR